MQYCIKLTINMLLLCIALNLYSLPKQATDHSSTTQTNQFISILNDQQTAVGNILYNLEVSSTSGVTQRGDPKQSIQSLQSAIKLLSTDSYAFLQFNFSLASLQVMTGDLEGAKKTYSVIQKSAPNNQLLQTFLAAYSLIWAPNNTEKYLEKLSDTGWNKASTYTKAIHIAAQSFNLKINEVAQTENKSIIPDILSKNSGKGVVIVTLGYALNEDGAINPIMKDRLEVTLSAFNRFPQSRIIVSGSDPRGGVTEAYQMSNWLSKNGVPSDHIIMEDQADSTIWNALYSINVIQKMNNLIGAEVVKNIILISSSAHIRRGTSDFNQALANQNLLTEIGLYNLTCSSPGYDINRPITTQEKALIIRDTLQTAGLWAMPGMVH
ncbi:YdcF family protein [Francisellaceae bacterium]|nr:YdcF family protein [Francisellaceae bacterium]